MAHDIPIIVRPFKGMRPVTGRADDIAAPPYDVVNVEEARSLSNGKPHTFFHVSRAEIDLPPGTDPYATEVYQTAAGNLKNMEESGILIRDTVPCFYIYRITANGRSQTGVAFSASVDAYNRNQIKKHEMTRPSKEDDRVRQIDTINAITGPVLTVHRSHSELSALINSASSGVPEAVAADVGGARHELWVVSNPDKVDAISAAINGMDAIYIADGHHRSAAAVRVAEARRNANPDHDGTEPYNGFLAVSFPDDELTILDYNRVVRDLNGMTSDVFRMELLKSYSIEIVSAEVRPQKAKTFGMYLDGSWSLISPIGPEKTEGLIESLDVQLLYRSILSPLLGVGDQRTDIRIDFVGGSRGPEEVARRVDSGEMKVGFTLYPPSIADLMSVADANMIMPPKSTWFEPKLADGMISLPLD
ncbi:MAG: hypothetical protein CFH41_02784 [Alphaproteobacteria bacterium MarineAlpha11_Bin1]|nr:MAG: hypothetical protein CFH41_02784 [Alphaproteobacteria bacterium MarineAlpha11_Bin1]|tara:strand:+ start:981 stop:2234 length:1254 start_codon:yes stop_codon:yes gene_type:complete